MRGIETGSVDMNCLAKKLEAGIVVNARKGKNT